MTDNLRSSVEPGGPSRRGLWIGLAVGGLALCCCASAALAWFFGDTVVQTLQALFQLQ